jgi:hypothetical protein
MGPVSNIVILLLVVFYLWRVVTWTPHVAENAGKE